MSEESIRIICGAAVIIVMMIVGGSVLLGRWPWQRRD